MKTSTSCRPTRTTCACSASIRSATGRSASRTRSAARRPISKPGSTARSRSPRSPRKCTTSSPSWRSRRRSISKPTGCPTSCCWTGLNGWITDPLENLVIHFDTSTGKRLHRIAVGRKPAGIATEDGQIWVANRGAGTVERIDAKTARKRSAAIDTKGPLSGPIAVAADVVWAAGSNDVVRIEPRAD